MPHTADKLLVRKAQRNPKHFNFLYEKYYEQILRFVKSKVSDNEMAEDITSNVFEKALKKIDSFQWQGVGFSSWLYRIARNAVYDYYRSARRRKVTQLTEENERRDSAERSLDEELVHDEQELQLFRSISQLEKKDQYLIYFRYFEGMSIKEISIEVDISEANVATRLHRIRSLLKSYWEEDLLD